MCPVEKCDLSESAILGGSTIPRTAWPSERTAWAVHWAGRRIERARFDRPPYALDEPLGAIPPLRLDRQLMDLDSWRLRLGQHDEPHPHLLARHQIFDQFAVQQQLLGGVYGLLTAQTATTGSQIEDEKR